MFNLHDNITLKDTINKYIFWNIDGTLAPYRFNGRISDLDGTNNGQSIEEIETGIFFERQPSIHMQKVVATCGAKQNIIMGHCQVQRKMEDKYKWLDMYYPSMKDDCSCPKIIQKPMSF